MYKIYCCVISILFLGLCFSGYSSDAYASDGVRYISNRIKIIRPEKKAETSTPVPPETAVKETEKKEGVTVSEAENQEKAVSQKSEGMIPGEKTEAEIRQEVSELIGKKERFYSRKGRIDPFEPFLRKPEPEVGVGEKAQLKRRTPRTPLEKIDLSQLRLCAILQMSTKIRALVQESSGKGYVVKVGTYIGNKGGQVSKILKDRITVEEKYLDVFGKVSVREREMKLQQ